MTLSPAILIRNKFDFRNVHGIMNISGLLQSKLSPKGFTLILQETQGIHDSINRPNIHKYNLYLGKKTVFYLIYNRINGFV